jgi:hypothetical protein
VICAGRLEHDQRPVLLPYPADKGLILPPHEVDS